jgi:tripeptide aminopeptidase
VIDTRPASGQHQPAPHSFGIDPLPRTAPVSLAALRDQAHRTDQLTLRDQLELVAIPAPPFGEGPRGVRVAELFRDLGYLDAAIDEVGNVTAVLAGERPGPAIVVAAHLDTVFPEGTSVEPRRDGGRIYAPGITDNARGLAGMLAVARVLREAGIRPLRPVVFVATVGEEGAGDLRGVKHLFAERSPLSDAYAFVALDGSGLRRVVHRAIGSLRLRVAVHGPGGHSWADRGTANPIVAIAAATARLSDIALPGNERSALTVARIGGGTSVNAIPEGAWMELDLRSEEPQALARLRSMVETEIARCVETESRGRRPAESPLRSRITVIGDRPGGETPRSSGLVRAACQVTSSLGIRPELVASSTDANVPMALGIPSVAIGVGGDSGGIHTADEWYSNSGGAAGVERALMLILAAAGWTG